ncbi:MAG: polymer-forming cytoskeletal protein, partial [Chloroflexota bacterium]
MFSQSADKPAPDQSPAPIGMRELPPQPAKPVMPAYTPTPTMPDRSDDEAGPGPDDSVIARDDHFEGTFTSRGTVRVLGSVKGRIEAVRVRIEDGAHVDADVIVDEAIIAGEFTGNLTCRERLEARSSGKISGRVETFKLMLHEGASVEGEMHMLSEAASDASETIRGTAPVRGETKASSAKATPAKASPAKASPAKATPAKAEAVAPAPRTTASKSSSVPSSPLAPADRSTPTAKAVVAQLASRP